MQNTSIIGEAPLFLEMLEHVSRAAGVSKPVLVIGERGTGKELIASRLHYLSPRWEEPLVKVNCAALTEGILESELFGHEAGAFTGASRTHIGHFERADDGTLILDELATVTPRMQEKILRVIEYGEFERVGGSDTITVDVRIVGATNADLPALARRGDFRRDLLDRLAFDVITIPPLRERMEDIAPLANSFAINMAAELHLDLFAGFAPRAVSALLKHDWPGNVRELKNTIERSVYRNERPERPVSRIAFDPFASPFRPQLADDDHDVNAAATEKEPATAPLPKSFKAATAELEKRLISKALKQSRFNQRIAAELIDLTYDQFRGYVRKHKIATRPAKKRRASKRQSAR